MKYYEHEMNFIDVKAETISVIFNDSNGNKTNRLNLNEESIAVIEKKLKQIKKELKKDYLKVGDRVLWRGGFGRDAAVEAIIERIEVDCINKEGDEVKAVKWDEVPNRDILVDLKNGHWARGHQLTKI